MRTPIFTQKTIIGTLMVVLCLFGVSSAHDCKLVENNLEIEKTEAYEKFVQQFQGANYAAAYPAEAIRTALANLKKHCCSSQKLIDKAYCTKVDLEGKFPQSAFLYDHLIDVGLRRLDAFPDQKLRYELEADPTGASWRTFITQAGETKDGTTSKIIMEKYNTLRTSKMTLPSNPNNDELKPIIENYNNPDYYNNPDKVSLADKYNVICEIIENIYNEIRADSNIVIKPGYHTSCLALTKKRIQEEYIFAKYMMLKKSNELMYESTKAYMHKYFVEEKLMDMLSLINKVKSLFATLVQQAPVSKTGNE